MTMLYTMICSIIIVIFELIGLIVLIGAIGITIVVCDPILKNLRIKGNENEENENKTIGTRTKDPQ